MGSKGGASVYDYRYALDYALCQGPIDSINYVWIKDKRAFCGAVTTRRDLCVSNDKLFGGDTSEGGINGVIECYLGTDDQEASAHLARRMGFTITADIDTLDAAEKKLHYSKAPAYPGIAHMFFRRTGTERGGFKWGTNNPYLPAIKASVTRIPRQLDTRWASIRPLTAVYADGEQPDQQDPASYGSGTAYPASDPEDYLRYAVGRKKTWNNGPFMSYWPGYWYMDQAPVQIVAFDLVGVCDTGYSENGYNPGDGQIQLDSTGNPVNYSLPPAESIATGAAYIRIRMGARVNVYGFLGGGDDTVVHSAIVEQYAADDEGNPTYITRTDWPNSYQRMFVLDIPVHEDTRFVRIAMSSNPGWIYNKVEVLEQSAIVYYPEVGFNHCDLEDTIGDLPDANPAHIVYELLVDESERDNSNMAQYVDADQLKVTAEKLFNEGFGISIRQDQSLDRQSLLKSIAEHTRGAIFQNPETGKWNYVLFRNDYTVASLQTIGPTDCKIVSGSRRAWSQCISEITVEYTDPKEEETASVTAHSDRGAAITGNRVPETRSFQFIRNSALAQQVANREVVEASYPLWSGTLQMSRKFWKLKPGDCFILNYVDTDFQIEQMVVRVTGVEFGEITSRVITVNVVEDIYSVAKTTYRAPQSTIVDTTDISQLPARTAKPQYMVPMSLPYAILERQGTVSNITDSEQHYRTVLFGSIDYRLDQVSVYYRNHSTKVQTLKYSANPCAVTRMVDSLTYSVFGYLSLSTIESVCPDGAIPGTLLMITEDIATDDPKWDNSMESRSELVELYEYDATNMRWKVKRGVFDTVPRQWVSGSLLWNIDNAIDSAQLTSELLDPDESPYPWYGKSQSGAKTTSNSAMWKVPVNATARNQLPTRPGNVRINGIGPDALIDTASNSTISALVVTWSTRNKESEETDAPIWSDGNYTAEAGETYIVRLRDPDDSTKIRYESSPISGTTITIPLSSMAPRGVVFVEVWAVDSDGQESLMASQNYVQIDKVALDYQGWDYQYGRNWSGATVI